MNLSCRIDLDNGQQLRYVVSGRGFADAMRKATIAAKKFNNGKVSLGFTENSNPPGVPKVRVTVTDKTIPEGTVNGRPKVVNPCY